jgi:very-short-patch-repair endonuclease
MRKTVAILSAHRRAEIRLHAMRQRHAPTPSEALLWLHLRGRQQLGVPFRRQVVLLRYIVDFYACSVRLIVEVDGPWHREHVRADARRDAALQRAGYRVLRLTDELVTRELPVALERVRQAIASAEAVRAVHG